MPDHADVVGRVKAALEARGVNLSGPAGAFEITKRVAWALRAEGAGLLAKDHGNNWLGYSVDCLCYPDGRAVDVLIDAGGANTPAWQDAGRVEPSWYVPAIDPGDAPTPAPPGPTPAPGPEPPDDGEELAALVQALRLIVDGLQSVTVAVVALTAVMDERDREHERGLP